MLLLGVFFSHIQSPEEFSFLREFMGSSAWTRPTAGPHPVQSSSCSHLQPEPALILPGPRPKPRFKPHLNPSLSHLWSPLHPSQALAGAPTARSCSRPAASSLASCAGNRWAPCGRGSSTEANPLLSRYGDSHPVKWNGLSIRGSLPARGFSITGLSRIGEKQHLLTRVPVRERLGWGKG